MSLRFEGHNRQILRDYSGKVTKSNLESLSIKEDWNSEKIKKIRELHKSGKRKTIEPGCRNCHHGAEKHGADYVPKEWDVNTQQWLKHEHLSKKRKYNVRANNPV